MDQNNEIFGHKGSSRTAADSGKAPWHSRLPGRMADVKRQGDLPRMGSILETCLQSAVDRALQRWDLGAAQCGL